MKESLIGTIINLVCAAIIAVSFVCMYGAVRLKMDITASEDKCVANLVKMGIERSAINKGDGTCWIMVRK